MTLAEAVKLILMLSIVLTVLALALRARAADFLYLFREWRLGLRAFLAMFVIVPAVAILAAGAFDLKPPIRIALVALAFSPVPPLLPKKQTKAGSGDSYIIGLLVGAALVSLVVAPLGLALTRAIFGVETRVSLPGMATTLGITIALPLLLGQLGQRLLGDKVEAASRVVGKVATILFVASVLVLLIKLAPAIRGLLGDGTLVVLIAMSLVGLAAGWWLAGGTQEERAALSLAAAARHPGVAIGIAATSFPDARLAPAAIILAAVINALIAIPYLVWLRKREG
jgi:BASS family bile acid:Na+ symporter